MMMEKITPPIEALAEKVEMLAGQIGDNVLAIKNLVRAIDAVNDRVHRKLERIGGEAAWVNDDVDLIESLLTMIEDRADSASPVALEVADLRFKLAPPEKSGSRR